MKTQMTPREAILAILNALPDRKVEGKKRLQKLAQLLQFSGLPIRTSFTLHHYGPYSVSLAEAAEELCLMNEISCKEEPRGSYGMLQSIYSLQKPRRTTKLFSDKHQRLLNEINRYTTIELEVAATIALFLTEGLSRREAIEETKDIKPTRAIPGVLRKADAILTACEPSM